MLDTRRILLPAVLLLSATAAVQAEDGLYAAGSIGVTEEHFDSSYLSASSNDVELPDRPGLSRLRRTRGRTRLRGFPARLQRY